MRNFSITLLSAIAGIAFLCGCGARAEDKPAAFNASEARAVTSALDRDQRVLARYEACPADIFRKDISLGGLMFGDDADVTAEHCAQWPSDCFADCSTKRSGERCYRLALAFQDNETIVEPRYAQMMFQMACALGKASGCTNRAAHLRNAASEGDPLTRLPPQEQEKCEFRSFDAACRKDDPWGCAMLGQAYKNGEGVRRSAASARRYFHKSCSLDPDFAACDFSRSALDTTRAGTRRRR